MCPAEKEQTLLLPPPRLTSSTSAFLSRSIRPIESTSEMADIYHKMATTSATPEVVPTAAAAAAAAAATATAGSVAAVAALVGPPAAAAGQKLAPAPGGSGGLVSSSIGAGLGTSVAVTVSTVAVAAQVLDSEDPPLLFAVLAGGLAGGAADFALHRYCSRGMAFS